MIPSGKMPEPVFVPQFATAEEAESRVANAKNEDGNLPEWNWCGICCVRMILLGLGRTPPSLLEMYRTATDAYRAYRMEGGRVVGAYHRELTAYVSGEHGLKAKACRGLSVGDVRSLLQKGSVLIVSVSPEIRRLDGGAPAQKNGHLVVVYAVEDSVFVLHNSAGFVRVGTHRAFRVPESRFAECFSGNGIVVSLP
jgi:hypothetical protein